MEPNELASRLRRSIKQRHISASALSTELVIELEMSPPLPPELVGRLLIEGVAASNEAIPGLIRVRRVDVQPDRVKVVIDRLAGPSTRLDVLLEIFRRRKRVLSPQLALFIVGEVARTLGALSLAVRGAAHGYLSDRAVLLARNGSITLIGAARSLIVALLVPAGEEDVIAPEVARGERRTAQTDVYALGALYYQLLADAPYRGELPGALKDAPELLLAVVGKSLAVEKKDRFLNVQVMLAAALEELVLSGQEPATAGVLEAAIDEELARELVQSEAVLFGAEEAVFPVVEVTSRDVLPPPRPLSGVRLAPTPESMAVVAKLLTDFFPRDVEVVDPALDVEPITAPSAEAQAPIEEDSAASSASASALASDSASALAEEVLTPVEAPFAAAEEVSTPVEASPAELDAALTNDTFVPIDQPSAEHAAVEIEANATIEDRRALESAPTELEFPVIKVSSVPEPVSPPPAKQIIEEPRMRHRALPPVATPPPPVARAPMRSNEKIRWVPITERARGGEIVLSEASAHPEERRAAAVEERPARSRRMFVVLIALLLLAAAGTAGVFAMRDRPMIEETPINKTLLELEVESVPAGATVLLDGEHLGVTPLSIERDLGSAAHTIELSAQGYKVFTRTIRANEAKNGVLSISVALER